MNTPNIDSFFTEVAALRNSQDSLRIENENLKTRLSSAMDRNESHIREGNELRAKNSKLIAELAQKQESWGAAAKYRDRVLDLVKQCDEKSRRIEILCKENAVLECKVGEAVEGLRNLLAMCERAHQKGYFPWEFDTKAASEARHILSKHP